MVKVGIAGAVLFLGLAGCIVGDVPVGEEEQPLLAAPAPSPGTACEAFCAGAAEVGCPREGDCLSLCERKRASRPGCEEELDWFLDCAKTRVRDDNCGLSMPMPDEPIEGNTDCLGRLELWESCSGTEDAPMAWVNRKCVGGPNLHSCDLGFTTVELHSRCHQGECNCYVNDVLVHECNELLFELGIRGCCFDHFNATFGP